PGDHAPVLVALESCGSPSGDDLQSAAVCGDIDPCAGSQTQRITQLLGQDDSASGIDDCLHGIRVPMRSHSGSRPFRVANVVSGYAMPSWRARSGPPTSRMKSGSPQTTSWSRARDNPT